LASFGCDIIFWLKALFASGPNFHSIILVGGSQSGTPSYK